MMQGTSFQACGQRRKGCPHPQGEIKQKQIATHWIVPLSGDLSTIRVYYLFTVFDYVKTFLAFVGDVLPILGFNTFLREEFATHAHTEDASLEP